ncbi:MAG: CDGSH iron-sulfur domain-containing protein [Gammaproteobacteria bacterium]|nr:CDGSH iron-sulfur domain-containing protein [Gammaproteobacteria bacterium]MDH4314644.1 CDGSH iron-sulfur domain-containing protein [Gammaproteobacteria bacterium]MDH5212880.1 CDGSH iron-sulfur domain-containing protein [Gammaproteobacteria bacterium]
MAKSDQFVFPGSRASVSWNSRLCIHIGECGRAKGNLFITGRKPWCQPDLVSDSEVEEVVLRCPSGALSVQNADGSRPEKAAAENTVTVAQNGPLYVRGELQIEGAPENAPGLMFRAALCRCGRSANKPFCDNSHEKAGFLDSGAVGETGPGAVTSGGPLQVKPSKDGPLLFKGNLVIQSGNGRRAWSGSQVALCRCGGSENKPFCDGSHKKNGFTGD